MEHEPEQKSSRTKPKWLTYLFGVAGLLLLNAAADVVERHGAGTFSWMLLAAGVGFLVLALWWAARR